MGEPGVSSGSLLGHDCFLAANMASLGDNHTGIARSDGCLEWPMNCLLAASLPERSAVVTRRSEPAMSRDLAEFGKFSTSDMAVGRVLRGKLGNHHQSRFGLNDRYRQHRLVSEPGLDLKMAAKAYERHRIIKKSPK